MSNIEDRAQREAERFDRKPVGTIVKWAVIIAAVVLVLTVIGNAAGIASIYWQAEEAKLTVKPRVTQRVYTPENVIAQINFFHDQCRGVQADLNIFVNNHERYESDLRAAHLETDPLKRQADVESLSSEQQDVTAALNAAQQAAQSYNSQSAKSTANPFKDSGLPRRIELPPGEEAAARFALDCK